MIFLSLIKKFIFWLRLRSFRKEIAPLNTESTGDWRSTEANLREDIKNLSIKDTIDMFDEGNRITMIHGQEFVESLSEEERQQRLMQLNHDLYKAIKLNRSERIAQIRLEIDLLN